MPSTTIASAKAAAKPGAPQSEITDARAEGLRLRIGARGVRWQYRCKIKGENLRLDLGSVDEWSIAEARDIAGRAQDLVRGGVRRPDADWLFEQRVRFGKVDAPATPVADPRHSLRWTWEDGKKAYLEHVERTLKPRTHADYANILRTPELDRFAGRPVASITLKQMLNAIGDIHARGVERHAEHVASVVRPMWAWMGHLRQQDESGLENARIMQDLEAPPRSRTAAKPKRVKKAPELFEIGRALVIARSGAFHPTVSAALQLLIYGVQRATATVTAHRSHFRSIGNGEGLWSMPPAHRKTAERRGDEAAHHVPLPAPIWRVIDELLDATDDQDPSPYLFRGVRPKRAGDTVEAIAASNLQHGLMYMPGVSWSPHDIRTGFTVRGSKAFRWTLPEVKTILDHNEGRGSGDVTVLHYLYDGTDAKWPMMRNWSALVEDAAAEALRFDDRLADVDWIKRHIVKARELHKRGKQPGVSLIKGLKKIETPARAEPIAL